MNGRRTRPTNGLRERLAPCLQHAPHGEPGGNVLERDSVIEREADALEDAAAIGWIGLCSPAERPLPLLSNEA